MDGSGNVGVTQEDRAIADLVDEHGTKNWAAIAVQLAKQLGGRPRSGKQCRERYASPHPGGTITSTLPSRNEDGARRKRSRSLSYTSATGTNGP
jgi:hypothetical protein